MQVKTILGHGNPAGPVFWKEPGEVYELGEVEAAGLIASGIVAPVEMDADPATDAEAATAEKPRRGAPQRQD